MSEVIKHNAGAEAVPIEAGLQQFEDVLTYAMEQFGLPSEGVLVSFVQRGRVLRNFEDAIDGLTIEHRARSMYLSKFMAAVGAGLFDAALNYLWDETISELRRRVAGYDLGYFFDIAVKDPERRKKLQTEDDLLKVDDFDLIRASNDIELVSDVGYKQLDLIRYMRNYASAAHPNQNEISAMQLLGWLETCITQVITLPETPVVAETKRLLVNVKTRKLSAKRAGEISEFFDDLRQDQADNLAAGLFGIYCQQDTPEETRDNVRLLFPRLWQSVGETQRQQFGVKYGRHVANGDDDEAEWARELLDTVDGSAYLPEPLRVAEISSAIDDLLHAHRGWDNFHAEPSRARLLERTVGDRGVPESVRQDYVLALIEVFLTNGHGVAWNAEPVYQRLMESFTRREAEAALLAFTNTRIASRLQMSLASQKFEELLDVIEPKLGKRYQEIATAIRESNAPADKLANDSKLKRLVEALSK
ncbi:MAG: hypothetical protein ACXIVQ_02430 [Acidimicrobiales bacterium]